MTAVSLRNIYKSYGNTEVVKGINLQIQDRDFVVLVGPSGCGKSTTLRMISGLEEITSGDLLLDGEFSNHLRPGQRNIAMVFQDYALYPHMTVFDNMAFSLKLKKVPYEEIEKRVMKSAEMLDLIPYLKRRPAHLSGGQRQRVAMGRAICKNSKIFLFDEPLSNLDAKLRSTMRREIKKFHKKNKITSVYVTHDQLEAMTLADKLVVMNQGKIEQVGSPLEVYERPKTVFVAKFIGSPGMNIIPMKVEKVNENLVLVHEKENVNFILPQEKSQYIEDKIGQTLLMGIRPSDIMLSEHLPEHDSWIVSLPVEMTELVGKNAFVSLAFGEDQFVGEIAGHDILKLEQGIEDKHNFYFNLNYIHLFDQKTTLNLMSNF